jgi:hypothetical protein
VPKREDEYWLNQKDNLRYCPIHKKHYELSFGCPLCQSYKYTRIIENKESIKLEICPGCYELSLSWNDKSLLYECLNLRCERSFSNIEFEEQRVYSQLNGIDLNEITNNDNIVNVKSQKCPSCNKETLLWNDVLNLYECTNIECKRRLSRFMKKGLGKLMKDI